MSGEPTSSLDVVTDVLGLHEPNGHRVPKLGVLRSGGEPRFLLPLDTWRASGAACLAFNRLREPRTRLQRGALGVALRAGGSRVLAGEQLAVDDGPDSLLAHLRDLLGDDSLCVAVGLGSLDTVWKPTLQVLTHDGRPLAYVKIGWTPFTTELVENEAATLFRWDQHRGRGPITPRLLARSRWRDLVLVATAPMPTDVRRIADDSRAPSPSPVRALDGAPVTVELASTDFWTRLGASIETGAGSAGDRPLADAFAAATDAFGHQLVPIARWHGDWTPWNLAQSSSRGLVAWDWEYSAPGAPVGLDEVHSAFQISRLLRDRSAAESFALSGGETEPMLAATQPLMAAERVQRALRAECPLDEGGAETLATAPAAVARACAR